MRKNLVAVLVALVAVSVSASAAFASPSVGTSALTTQFEQSSLLPQEVYSGIMWTGLGTWEDSGVVGLVVLDGENGFLIREYDKNAEGIFKPVERYMAGKINNDKLSGVYYDENGNVIDSFRDGGWFFDGVWRGHWYFTWKDAGIFVYGQYLPFAEEV